MPKKSPKKTSELKQVKSIYKKFRIAQRERGNVFLSTNKHLPPREKAEAWLLFTADSFHLEMEHGGVLSYLPYEIFTYLASRNMLEDHHREMLLKYWHEDEKYMVEECRSQNSDLFSTAPPTPDNTSSLILRNFWEIFDVEEYGISTSMFLRAKRTCDIPGFKSWLKRLAKELRTKFLKEGIEGGTDAAFCFFMARSDLALEIAGETLALILERSIQYSGEYLLGYKGIPPWHHGFTKEN